MSDRYREQPREVNAWRYDTGNYPMPNWLRGLTTRLPDGRLVVASGDVLVVASPGDYLVRWPDGRIGVYPPEAFAAGFEPMEDA